MNKIVLVQPPDPPKTQILRDHMGKFGIVQDGSKLFRYDLIPPLDLAYSASLLEKNGFNVNIIDAHTLNLSQQETIQQVKKEHSDLILVNTAAVSIPDDLNFAAKVKNATGVITAVASSYSNLIPKNELPSKKIDLVVHGEMEYTLLELAEKFPEVKKIQGLWYIKDKKIVRNQDRPFIKNLDELPFPAHHLLPMKKYTFHLFKRKPFFTIMASRGCPYKCMYCAYPLCYGNVWRGRSSENVMSELRFLVEKYKIKGLGFRDQVFTFDMKRAERICDSIIKEGIDIEWRCETRVDRLSKKLMIKMKKSGCAGVHMGVESGDPLVLEKIAKVGLSVDRIKKIFREAKEVGLETVAFFMIGFPEETRESISKTINLAKELNSDITWFTAAAPYPGTKLYDLAEKKGWIITKDWKKYSGREVVMRTDNLTEQDIKTALSDAKIMFSGSGMSLVKKGFSRKGISLVLSNPKKVMKYVFSKIRS